MLTKYVVHQLFYTFQNKITKQKLLFILKFSDSLLSLNQCHILGSWDLSLRPLIYRHSERATHTHTQGWLYNSQFAFPKTIIGLTN